MNYLKQISIYQLAITFLLVLYFLGIWQFGFQKVSYQFLPAIVATTATGAILDYLELKRWVVPKTPFITGCIIGLVGQFGETFLVLSAIGISSMLIKFFIKWDGRHIFNPAASGLLVGMLLFKSYPAWWIGGVGPWIFLIWIPLFLYKMKRWAPIVGFLVPTLVFSGFNSLVSPSLLFFSSVMLIEPKTSPGLTVPGLIYGLIVATAFFYSSHLIPGLDPLVTGLLIGNLGGRLLGKVIV